MSISLLTGCQVGYLIENAYYQADLILSRQPLEKALKDESVSQKKKQKLQLAYEAKVFAETELGLKPSQNYNSFVELNRPYVVHSLTVSPKDRLEAYTWWFPFFGEFPYLGYFNQKSAQMAKEKYKQAGYDTYLRGVSAFSSLGWFKDPILSSMLQYSDYNLVNIIIHETVHATLYIKNAVDFNERLATFVGNIGTEMFYRKKEGQDSETLKKAKKSTDDEEKFSAFISKEIEALEKWYQQQKKPISEELRKKRLAQIQEKFKLEVLPLIKISSYEWFIKKPLNNAQLINYKTYYEDLSDFEKLYNKVGKDFSAFLDYCKKLERENNPEQALKDFVKNN